MSIEIEEVRVHNWINTETFKPMFGIEAKIRGGGWAHVAEDGTALLFETMQEAENAATRYGDSHIAPQTQKAAR